MPARANSEADQSSFLSFETLAQRRHHARNRCVHGKHAFVRGDAANTLCLSVGSGARVFISKGDLSILQACFKGVQASCLKSTSQFPQRVTSAIAFGTT